ncbi:MFS transporter [Marinobacterium rhizophilum]|uniref:MFS transporter n=1 Tax=Marinobacterium rhizophilum TaxID=420402 RepID=UPI000378061F|nr:MFS transporter [Marinobacterium rhizophilum]
MRTSNLLHDWREVSVAGRVLIANGFTFNLGFYMLLPYLADHLQRTLGLSPWYAGLVIGLRVLSQQGLFLVGGTLGDYLGYKRLILLGCVVRVGGFALLAIAQQLPALLAGAFLTGLAGALFTPSSNAYLAYEAPDADRRDRIFALQNWSSEAGMFLGPLVGIALLRYDFALVGLGAALLFLMLLWMQWRFLPELTTQEKRQGADSPFWRQWQTMLCNPRFMGFIAFACAFHLFFHQLYLSLPDEVKTRGLDAGVITTVFVISSVLGICLQVPLNRRVPGLLGRSRTMGLGLALMGSAFLWFLTHFASDVRLSFVGFAATFSLGSMLVMPLLAASVPRFCERSELGSYYGLYSCVGGLAAFSGHLVLGGLLSSPGLERDWIWIGLAAIGLMAGFGLYRQMEKDRRTEQAVANAGERVPG